MAGTKSLLFISTLALATASIPLSVQARSADGTLKLAQGALQGAAEQDHKDGQKKGKPDHKQPPGHAQPKPHPQQAHPQPAPKPHPQQAQPKPALAPKQQAQPKPAQQQPQQQHQAQPKPAPQPRPQQAQPKSGQQPQHQQAQPKPALAPKQQAQPKPAQQQQQQQHQVQPKPAEPQPQPQQAQPKSGQQPQQQQAQPKPALAPRQQAQPKPAQQQQGQPNRQSAAPPPPQHPRDAGEFIRGKGKAPARNMTDIHKERRETREGDRVIMHEGDRTIVREHDRTIIRHNEADRFAVGARNVHVERRDGRIVTIVERPNGVRIITVTDADGHLIRRVRRDPNGHEVVIIDEDFAGPRREVFVQLPPPVIHIPRDRYIVEADRARPQQIYDVLMAQPVDRIEHRYTMAQVRYSEHLRQRMPRLDLDIHFDTGSWQLTPDQVDRLAAIARQLNRVIDRNPQEVFLIEGHTDAVGSQDDNLSLSDRRAEAVAVALTEMFHVPPENLVTQGYGEQELKVQTQGPERANRRVAVRRITPLIDRRAAQR